VVVDLETHAPNEGDIFCPILCIEDKVRNFFSLLVDIDSGGGCFSWSRILPKLIRWPLFFYLNPLLHSMYEAGDSAALKENV